MVTCRTSFFRAARALVAGFLVAGVVGPVRAGAPTEYELKAIFLYNFAKYVEWESLPPSESVSLCVLGADPFGEILDGTVEGETVQGRSLVVRRVDSIGTALSCQVVFVAESEEGRLAEVLDAFAERTILTVGESEGFAARGGIIRLREEGNRIRIVINVAAAKRAGLRISSQLLKLGEVVGEAR